MADRLTGWQPDPYGLHEFRFFSEDGKATLLVSDGGSTSHDRPPTEQSHINPEPEPEPEPEIKFVPPLQIEPADSQLLQSSVSIKSDPGAVGLLATTGTLEAVEEEYDSTEPRHLTEPSDTATSTADHFIPSESANDPLTLSKSRKIAYAIVFAGLALSVLGLVYVQLIHKTGIQQAVSTSTTTTTSPPTSNTTTTVGVPSAPQSSPTSAATALVSSWAGDNRAAALSVATPSAVGTLFASTYADGMAINRGCSTSAPPVVCTFGPPGGASPTDPIYEVYVSQAASGWYVSEVKVEN